jgi:hypothetical protein
MISEENWAEKEARLRAMQVDIEFCYRSSRSFFLVVRRLIGLLTICLAFSCTTQTSEEKTMEIRFRDTVVDPSSVSVVLPLVASSHPPDDAHLSPAHQTLFTYLAQKDPAALVTTEPHSQGEWRIEKVFLLDDCVAVQMTEGHYLETLFFVQYRDGWRLKSRIIPTDHE